MSNPGCTHTRKFRWSPPPRSRHAPADPSCIWPPSKIWIASCAVWVISEFVNWTVTPFRPFDFKGCYIPSKNSIFEINQQTSCYFEITSTLYHKSYLQVELNLLWFLHYCVPQFGHDDDISQLLLPFGLNVQYITTVQGCIDQMLAMPLRSVIVTLSTQIMSDHGMDVIL